MVLLITIGRQQLQALESNSALPTTMMATSEVVHSARDIPEDEVENTTTTSTPSSTTHNVMLRRQDIRHYADLLKAIPAATDVDWETFTTSTSDGHKLSMVWYTRKGQQTTALPGPAMLHIHGGGFIAFCASDFHNILINNVSSSGVPILTVDYRLAPEHPYPTPLNDCYHALTWLRSHGPQLNVDARRIGVLGESAGGGLAAALALLARDRSLHPPLAKQILVYPMLDDRNTITKDADLIHSLTHNWDDNMLGWAAYLGSDVVGSSRTSAYAAPARATDLSGLPSAYIDVGTLDIFLEEDLEYVQRLRASNVEVESHVYEGVPHAFDILEYQSKIASAALARRALAMQSF